MCRNLLKKKLLNQIIKSLFIFNPENLFVAPDGGGAGNVRAKASHLVSIVRALVTKPKVLLMDEPFSALDALTRATLQDHLLGLWEASQPTLLLVTHDVEEAAALADRAVVMQPRPGRIFADIAVPLPRPRDRLSPGFVEAKRAILSALDGSLSQDPVAPGGKSKEISAGSWW